MYKKGFFLILALFTLLTSVHAQEEKKSSRYLDYKEKLKSNSAADLLREAQTLKLSNPSKALENVREALGLSLASKDVFHEGKSYLVLGEVNESIEEWKLAMENYTIA